MTVCGGSHDGVVAANVEAGRLGLQIEAVQIDVCDSQALSDGIAAAASDGLDALVCCAGKPTLGNASDLTLKEWDDCLDLNLRAYFAASRAAVAGMSRRGGGIVFISSIWSVTATADRTAYITAKTALTGLARALAVDHAASGIRVNCVAPGFVETQLLHDSLSKISDNVAGEVKRISNQVPLRRLVSPDDIAEAVAFLAGERARSITGQTLVVDGGVTVRLTLPETTQ